MAPNLPRAGAAPEFGELLRRAMTQRGKTERDVHEHCGVQRELVVAWLRGEDVPRGRAWPRLMGMFHALKAASALRARALVELERDDVDAPPPSDERPTMSDESIALLGAAYAKALRREVQAQDELGAARDLLNAAERAAEEAREDVKAALATLNAAVR
jgi:hypothetical protein